ncbi:helix-turn-helix transcriptional regulator [Burkholderia sp. Nafp2/4-1b]|uniref:helix-turn-helix domain-containing protein n=1 Tax=Burkholderia sp. Nafp2/4-1b TaxID=2116686 RepID=UPI000EF913D6|nr:helix-turn-helix transcriptional regulator [Burkholderia sp. Nafp2/4-1b]
MGSLGERLREERIRIGLSQKEFGAIAGMTKQTQFNYEAGTRSPDVIYLMALRSVGIDLWYVLTGERSLRLPTDDESEVVGGYRLLSETGRSAIKRAIRTLLANDIVDMGGKMGQSAARQSGEVACRELADGNG